MNMTKMQVIIVPAYLIFILYKGSLTWNSFSYSNVGYNSVCGVGGGGGCMLPWFHSGASSHEECYASPMFIEKGGSCPNNPAPPPPTPLTSVIHTNC